MCYTPITVKNSNGDEVQVPCSKCPACTSRRVSAWSFRIMQEYKRSTSAQFITLTYDNSNVPITPRGFMSLHETTYEYRIARRGKNRGNNILAQIDSHLQSFFKRLRKAQFGNQASNIKYYACGEYGGITNRPHYHCILFNAKLELIQEAWNMGQIHYGEVNEASVGYTLKYMCKPSRIPMHKNDDRVPEYALMSKKLGDNYITPEIIKWHHADKNNRMYCNLEDGKKITMPRYYKEKIYDETERILIGAYNYAKMLQKQNDAIELLGLVNYERYLEQQKVAAFEQQRNKSKSRQKTF